MCFVDGHESDEQPEWGLTIIKPEVMNEVEDVTLADFRHAVDLCLMSWEFRMFVAHDMRRLMARQFSSVSVRGSVEYNFKWLTAIERFQCDG